MDDIVESRHDFHCWTQLSVPPIRVEDRAACDMQYCYKTRGHIDQMG